MLTLKLAHPVPISDIGASAGNETPPPMHRSRRLGWACRDTPKEAKLHGRQCPSDASLRVKFPRLYSDAPKRGCGYCSSPFPRGKSNALSPAVHAEKQFTPSHTSSCHRQNGENYSIILLLNARGHAKNRASTKTRGFQTILPRKVPLKPHSTCRFSVPTPPVQVPF